ncbi:MAG: hypothetical protein EHM28_13130, partial [Spirochaetaceae bacterium]
MAVFSLDILDYYPVLSMETGSINLTTAFRAGICGTGLLLDMIPLDENYFWEKTAGIVLRLMKGAILDVNFEMF